MMRRRPLSLAAIAGMLTVMALGAHAEHGTVDVSGDVRVYADRRVASTGGPLAQGRALSASIEAPASWTSMAEVTLKASWATLSSSATLRDTGTQADTTRRRVVLNELSTTNDWGGGMHSTVGKKVVSWDVGYAFRPNDIVQREMRRTLVPSVLEGRPMGMLESFGPDSAWSALIFRQDLRPQDQRSVSVAENVVAGRYYARIGAADAHAFWRVGSATGGGFGAALSIVDDASTEVHASIARTGRFDSIVLSPGSPSLALNNPYALARRTGAPQLMVGMTWTNEAKFSVLAEAWYDGTAPSRALWADWETRGRLIAAIVGAGGSPSVVGAAAGNLGWQATLLQSAAIRRQNLFLRASWTNDAWQPSIDILLAPEDRGLVVTAGIMWQGDRVRLDMGARRFGGAKGSIFAQMPLRSMTYAGLIVPF